MNYYKGLKNIGKTGEFENIPDDLLIDYIQDFTIELKNRIEVKKITQNEIRI